MTAITLHLPDDLAARLAALPDETRDALAADAVAAGMEDADELPDDELTAEDLAAIGAGLADMDAGRVRPAAEVFADLDAHLAELKRAKRRTKQRGTEQRAAAA